MLTAPFSEGVWLVCRCVVYVWTTEYRQTETSSEASAYVVHFVIFVYLGGWYKLCTSHAWII